MFGRPYQAQDFFGLFQKFRANAYLALVMKIPRYFLFSRFTIPRLTIANGYQKKIESEKKKKHAYLPTRKISQSHASLVALSSPS